MTKKQSTPKVIVGTVKKPIAAMASRWLRRDTSQRLAGSGALGARSSSGKLFFWQPVSSELIRWQRNDRTCEMRYD
jgi:hypothetical protein